jgi:hypothetical protein
MFDRTTYAIKPVSGLWSLSRDGETVGFYSRMEMAQDVALARAEAICRAGHSVSVLLWNERRRVLRIEFSGCSARIN